jgi:hypothetical protein
MSWLGGTRSFGGLPRACQNPTQTPMTSRCPPDVRLRGPAFFILLGGISFFEVAVPGACKHGGGPAPAEAGATGGGPVGEGGNGGGPAAAEAGATGGGSVGEGGIGGTRMFDGGLPDVTLTDGAGNE